MCNQFFFLPFSKIYDKMYKEGLVAEIIIAKLARLSLGKLGRYSVITKE